jgi:hypothetical protein
MVLARVYSRQPMNVNQPYIAQKTQQALIALNAARARAAHECTLMQLAHIVSRVHVNPLVKPLLSVRAAAHRLRAESERRAAQLAAALLNQFEATNRSPPTAQLLSDTYEACRVVFPREATLLRRALEEVGPVQQQA